MKNKFDLQLYTWNKTIKNAKANILFLHGYAEYSLRYTELAETCNRYGYNFYSMDYQGFGKSEGLPGYINTIDDIIDDVQQYITIIQDIHGFYFPLFLVGHSTGANIAVQTAFRDPSIFKALHLSSPLVKIDSRKITYPLYLFVKIWSNIFPKGFVCTSGLTKSDVSRNPVIVKNYDMDNYMYKDPIRVKTAHSLFDACHNVSRGKNLLLPIAIGVGKEDRVCNPVDMIDYYNELNSINKKLFLYNGLYHELFLEPERKTVIEDMLEFFRENE